LRSSLRGRPGRRLPRASHCRIPLGTATRDKARRKEEGRKEGRKEGGRK